MPGGTGRRAAGGRRGERIGAAPPRARTRPTLVTSLFLPSGVARQIPPLLRRALTATGCVAALACGEGDPSITLPEASARVDLALVAEGLTSPVTLVEPPGGAGRRFVVDQVGLIRVLTADGRLLPEPFLDLRAKLVPLQPGYDERG